jgi:hypothetical protein
MTVADNGLERSTKEARGAQTVLLVQVEVETPEHVGIADVPEAVPAYKISFIPTASNAGFKEVDSEVSKVETTGGTGSACGGARHPQIGVRCLRFRPFLALDPRASREGRRVAG